MARARVYGGTVSVEVDVDINDVLDELDDDTLREELESRGKPLRNLKKAQDEMLVALFDDLRDAIARRDLDEISIIVESYAKPKWHDPKLCEKEYLAALGKPSPTHEESRG